MTAIEDVMDAIHEAMARVAAVQRLYEDDETIEAVMSRLRQAAYDVEQDPGYQRDRIDRARRTAERLEGSA